MTYRYSGVDELAARAFALEESRGSIQAQDMRLIRGELCVHCGHPHAVRKYRRGSATGADFRVLCAQCGREWEPGFDHEYNAGKFRRCAKEGGPKRDAAENAMNHTLDEWLRLERVVFPVPRRPGWDAHRWGFALLSWRAWLHPEGGSVEAVAMAGQRAAAEHFGLAVYYAPLWTRHQVEDWIAKARLVVEDRALQRPALLAPRRRVGGALRFAPAA